VTLEEFVGGGPPCGIALASDRDALGLQPGFDCRPILRIHADVLAEGVGPAHAREGGGQRILLAAEARNPAAVGAGRDLGGLGRRGDELLHPVHHAVHVGPSLVELDHRELGVVARREPLVAEYARKLEYALDAADQQPLQVQLRRNPEVQVHVERVVPGQEGSRVGAAVDRMQHRRLHFGVAMLQKHHAHGLHHAAPAQKQRAPFRMGEQVHVAPPRAQFVVHQAVPFLRRIQQRLRHQPASRAEHRQLTHLRAPEFAGHADQVAAIQVLEQAEIGLAQLILLQADLDAPSRIVQVKEGEFSVTSPAQDAAVYGDRTSLQRVGLRQQIRSEAAVGRGARGIRVHTRCAQLLQVLDAIRLEEVHERLPG
jgi:hypothetical protein